MTNKSADDDKILGIKKYEQYRTVDDLMDRSRPTEVYYTLLILSSLVVAAGLLLNNAAVVIGGMLITPLITPLLSVGLGISIGDIEVIKKTGFFALQSVGIVIAAAFILGFIFEIEGKPTFFALQNALNGAVLYFIVALASGFAAAFAWIREEVSELLPGVAVAVALVPPLALMGLGLSSWDPEVVRGNFFVFFFNMLGVMGGSVLIFSLLKFYKVEDKIREEVEEDLEDDEKETNKEESSEESESEEEEHEKDESDKDD